MRKFALAFVLIGTVAAPALAQGSVETIVVTTTRDSFNRREQDLVPYVVLVRRADHLINRVTVSDDTRDPVLRAQELRQTLKALVQEAKRNSRISLSVGEKELKDFSESMIEGMVSGGGYSDSSRAQIVVKTAISSGDSFDSAAERIKAFARSVPKFGRSETTTSASWDLTIVNPEQYHDAVVAKIAAEARASAAKFGTDYGVIVDGLHEPLFWYREGGLNLALFLRYTMVVAQKGTGKVVIQRGNPE
jgi:DNA-binding helix-hairpin-helix protein with protein kinase domain